MLFKIAILDPPDLIQSRSKLDERVTREIADKWNVKLGRVKLKNSSRND